MSNKNNSAKNAKDNEDIIKIFDKQNDLKSQEKNNTIDEVNKKWNTNDRITNLFADKIEKDTKLNGRYAVILIGILIFQLIILNIIFILKGAGVLKFADSTFNIFITGGIAEIFVLVKTIVKSLFNDDLTELLKIILKANNYKANNKDINKKN